MLQRLTASKKTIAGFTLIELLVVVAIIAILASIGIAVYRNAQNRANDARRIAAVKAYQAALEQKYAQNNQVYSTGSITSNDFSDNINPSTQTWFSVRSDSTAYCAHALLQNSTGNCGGCTGIGQFTYSSTGSYFCVKNLQ